MTGSLSVRSDHLGILSGLGNHLEFICRPGAHPADEIDRLVPDAHERLGCSCRTAPAATDADDRPVLGDLLVTQLKITKGDVVRDRHVPRLPLVGLAYIEQIGPRAQLLLCLCRRDLTVTG